MTAMTHIGLIVAFCALAETAVADGHSSTRGDAAAGENQFNRQCGACHVVQTTEGVILAGRNTKPGPNLLGVAGRPTASMQDARYGDSLLAVGETGAAWNEAAFVAYVQDPTGWLRETLQDRRARSKMAYRVRRESEAFDLYAYLVSVGQ